MDDIPIIFQNDEIVAVEKPIGISIHNTEDVANLLSILEDQLKTKKLYPVHRLDKETSGVQIFARNELSARKFAEQFQGDLVAKKYVGVLRGQLNVSQGVWRNALSDKAEGRVNPAGLARDRVKCETRFRVVQTSKFFTKCEFDLITGRQHQIRKHAVIAGHAIVGDSRYGDSNYNRRIHDLYNNGRMFLHCHSLEIADLTLIAQEPAEFAALFKEA